ncbi:Neur-chan-LBD domain-containing protein [Aphelenchoides besseyi]|nr:Neur-chan-LBD domain-containing protein [Aphelenchoides besseyi]KAI6229159.1 Neur-chan-LBD domain-containing protein [Aphelenchoides besseyi]
MTGHVFLLSLFVLLSTVAAKVNIQRAIESRILRNYDRRHRPVKEESTTTNVNLLIIINHIETVDQNEQAMLVHGLLYAVWVDEYLQWDPKAYNNTYSLKIQAWKLWQPAISLYNAARTNSWHLYMGGKPNTVTNKGIVAATGVFSFYITCNFDFHEYPNDKQECPIVLTDWIYDMSKVNLTVGINGYMKSFIKLSSSTSTSKTHVGGWEYTNITEKICYYGIHGCESEYPESRLDNYWSIAEFRIHLQRHAPYFTATIRLPIILSVSLALLAFWIENLHSSVGMILSSILLECFVGYSLIKMLPPSTSTPPKIVYFYMLTFVVQVLVLTAHVLFVFIREVLPEDTEFPYQLTALTEKMRQWIPFRSNGIIWKSFDPQEFAEGSHRSSEVADLLDDPYQTQQPSTSHYDNENTLISGFENPLVDTEMEPIPPETRVVDVSEGFKSESTIEIQSDDEKPKELQRSSTSMKRSHLDEEIHTWRRTLFFFFTFFTVIVIFVFGLV